MNITSVSVNPHEIYKLDLYIHRIRLIKHSIIKYVLTHFEKRNSIYFSSKTTNTSLSIAKPSNEAALPRFTAICRNPFEANKAHV